MPDLFTHFASGYIPTRHRTLRKFGALVVLGTLLPDILTRIPEILLDRFLGLPVYHFFNALHTPTVLIICCYVLSFFFEELERKASFLALLCGVSLHLLLDIMQRQFYDGVYMPFFPVSFKTIQWEIFHYNASLLVVPLWLVLVTTIWFFERKK